MLFLPKVPYTNNTVDESLIKEVLPVYVVNMKDPTTSIEINNSIVSLTETINSIAVSISTIIGLLSVGNSGDEQQPYKRRAWGSGGANRSKNGISNRSLSFIDYGDKFGHDFVDLNNELIKLKTPEDSSVAVDADRFVGRKNAGKLDNKSIFPKEGWYKPTKETIAWAIENNKQFATGGMTFSDSFITGDARGNNIFAGGAKPELIETFSSAPVLSRITPIKKFAEGGTSFSVPAGVDKKTQEYIEVVNTKIGIVNAIKQFDGTPPDDPMSMSVKKLSKQLRVAVKEYAKGKKKKDASGGTTSTRISRDTKALGITGIDTDAKAQPVFVINEFANGNDLFNKLENIGNVITSNFGTLLTGLGTGFTLAAPYGVGQGFFSGLIAQGMISKVASAAISAGKAGLSAMAEGFGLANTGGHIKAASGGKINKFATGGSQHSVITGDAPGGNIFANGAKPELVRSTGDMDIIPLNKIGSENKTKIERMTPEERRNALATAISSHTVRFRYNLPEGATEISNEGEAIKVMDVKPGLYDKMSINGTETSVADVLGGIYSQLALLLGTNEAGNALLTAMAAKPTTVVSQSSQQPASDPNPYAGGFPESMNSILGGN